METIKKKSLVARGLRGEGDEQAEHRDFRR